MDRNVPGGTGRFCRHYFGYRVRRSGRSGSAVKEAAAACAVVVVFLLLGAMVPPLGAQTYPSRPVRLVLPFPPGGATDILGRIIGQKLAEQLGQPVVPENRPGAGGNLGIEVVAKARPDGYAILLTGMTIGISPSLYKKLNYDPIKDLAPISLTSQVQNLVLVRPSLPVKSLKELIEYAKANPGKLNFGSGGIGTPPHLAAELIKSLAKVNIVHVPYKGVNQAMIGMIGGEVDMVVIGTPAAIPQIKAEKVRALAILGTERLPALPNVPTATEAGIDNCEVISWYGLFAPAGTPRDIVSRLNAEWLKIAAMPDTREKMQKAGVEPMASTPEEFSEFFKGEIARWAKVVKEANLSMD